MRRFLERRRRQAAALALVFALDALSSGRPPSARRTSRGVVGPART
jgi:hypothetical protein